MLDESRRDLIKKGAVGAGLVWASPMVQSVTRPGLQPGGHPGADDNGSRFGMHRSLSLWHRRCLCLRDGEQVRVRVNDRRRQRVR